MERPKLSLRDETKALINSILIPHPAGMFLNAFVREFFNAERRELPYKEMGYNHPLQLLQSMPDAVKCTQMTSGHILVQAVPNKNNQHIKDMVVHQKKTNNIGVKKINEILRRQPFTIQHQISLSNTLKKERRPQPFVPDIIPEPIPVRETDAQIVSKLQELLVPYREGVDVDEIRDLYFRKFHNQLIIIESPAQFLSSYPNIFCLERENGQCKVLLREYQRCEPVQQVINQPQELSISPARVQNTSWKAPVSSAFLKSTYSSSQVQNRQRPNPGDFEDSEVELPPNFGVPKPKLSSVSTPNIVMHHQELPAAAYSNTGSDYFFIIVAEIYTPSKFYWFLKDKRKAIEKLSDDMTEFYNVNASEYKLTHDDMYVTQMVAVLFTDNLWYRGRVTRFPGNRLVEVFYVDYGTTCKVYIDQLRHLHVKFAEFPMQAFRGRLYGIKPRNKDYKWTAEASKCFLDLVKGSKALAAASMKREFVAINEKDVVDVFVLDLVDTNSADDIPILDYLIDHAHAVSDPEETGAQVQEPSHADAGNQNYLSPPGSPAATSSLPHHPSPQPTCPFPMQSGQFESFQQPEANQSRWFYHPEDDQMLQQQSSFSQVQFEEKRSSQDTPRSGNLLASLFPTMTASLAAPAVRTMPSLMQTPAIPHFSIPPPPYPPIQSSAVMQHPPPISSMSSIVQPPIHPSVLPPATSIIPANIPPVLMAAASVEPVSMSVPSCPTVLVKPPIKSTVSIIGSQTCRCIKPVVLGSGKRFHLIKPDDGPMLYLSGIELVTMLPQFRTEDDLLAHLKSMNLHISVRTIQLAMAPNLVFECVTSDIPWIHDDDGEVRSELRLYELKVISSILFIFQVKEPEIIRTFNAELKMVGDDPHWK